jgi:glycosyltransferase involved in cell wall biosynthesis
MSLLEAAHRHGLIGLLADPSSPSFWPTASPVYTRLAARQQVMRFHLRQLALEFSEAGVPVALLKGPWLAAHAYRSPMHRTFSDIDLVVPRDALGEALEIISAYEYVRSVPAQKPQADKREIPVRDPSGITFAVDLHWDLFSYHQLRGIAGAATAEAWSHASFEPDSTLGPLWQLPSWAVWVFLCTHATLDHRFRLILSRDLLELGLRAPDWEGVVDFASRHKLRSTTYVALYLARKWVAAPVPDWVLARLRIPSAPLVATERLVQSVDPVLFNGHRPHPLNLAMVLLHDQRAKRWQLAARAPLAAPGWWQKVRAEAVTEGPSVATIVVSSTRRRGAEVFGEQLGAGLFGSGWQSDLVSLSRTPEGPEVAATPLRETVRTVPRFGPRLIFRLRRRLQETGSRVVLANGSATLKYTAAALLGMRHRPGFIYASVGEPGYWSKGPLRRVFQRFLLSRTDLILAVSAATAGQLINGLGQPAAKVVVAETGVPADLLALSPDPADSEMRVLVMGSLSPEKDPETAVEVFAEWSKGRRGRLRFLGAGPLAAAITERSAQLGLDGSVELLGAVDNVREFLAWADVLLLTSRTEGLPGAVLEAGAAGIPSVGFDVGGVGEAIVDGITGFVVPASDVDAAVLALSRLSDDPHLRRQMGEAARQHVASRYLLTHAIDRYRRAFDQVARNRK